MNVLFIHQNFPGQFRHLANRLAADPANQVVAVGDAGEAGQRDPVPGVRLLTYPQPDGASGQTHRYVRTLEAHVRRGQAVCRLLLDLAKSGFRPDVIYAHPGWGESLFLREVYPAAPLLLFCEFFYRTQGADLNFDPEFPGSIDENARVRTRNATHLLSLSDADWGVAPTHWQRAQFPAEYQPKIDVIFDGIDTSAIAPDPAAQLHLSSHGAISRADEIITFVSRGLEPYRGIHTFIRALPEILRRRPNALVVMVGTDNVSYGATLESGTYRARYLAEIAGQADLNRVILTGWLSRADLTRLLQLSSAHVYLTYPFVLSWSMLEAMSAGCVVIGSATGPVMEVIEDGKNGLLVDFFDPEALAVAVEKVLAHPHRLRHLGEAARQTVLERYDLERICLPRQLTLLERLASGQPRVS